MLKSSQESHRIKQIFTGAEITPLKLCPRILNSQFFQVIFSASIAIDSFSYNTDFNG